MTFGRYEITRKIGRGGMGVVYEARDPRLNRTIALKVLPRQFAFNPRFVERFLREGRLAASLSRPNVVSVHEAGEANGQYFLPMEHVEGTDLAELLRKQVADFGIAHQLRPLGRGSRRSSANCDLRPRSPGRSASSAACRAYFFQK